MIRVRRLSVVGAMIFVILGAGAGIASAQEEETSSAYPEFGVDLAFVNKYVWRGMLLTDGPVFQPCRNPRIQGGEHQRLGKSRPGQRERQRG